MRISKKFNAKDRREERGAVYCCKVYFEKVNIKLLVAQGST